MNGGKDGTRDTLYGGDGPDQFRIDPYSLFPAVNLDKAKDADWMDQYVNF